MYRYNEEKELYEAINAGQEAIEHLSDALVVLNKAKDWGMLDMFGGGMIISMVKRSRMSEADEELRKAQRCIDKFKRELQDVREFIPDIEFDTDYMGFMDYAFDGFLIDFLVQEKINKAIANVRNTIDVIDEILDTLETELSR